MFQKTMLAASVLLLSACVTNQEPTPTVSPDLLSSELAKTQQVMVEQCTQLNSTLSAELAHLREQQAIQLQDIKQTFIATSKKKTVVVAPAPVPTPKCEEVLLPTKAAVVDGTHAGKIIVGEEEWVRISPPKVNLLARIDTGAAVSSIHAVNVVEFERDGEKWVKFDIGHEEGQPDMTIERRVERYSNIRQSTSEETVKRPVIKLNIRLGTIKDSAEFTLADRGQMSYPVLLGREFLKDITLVDPGKQQIHPEFKPQ
ncbi:ATP-dependent zinc protease [Motilimonas sp. 1_MG-2023]|uniref:ATP-dependent zinc protease family protein n=1 Tax=Motilimonas sp. 1_MG-2023 TaxID=3062672 RepID=UPI0026E35595|nr:ATP-dependent zinc protease [Motilimonas sp. 1_MG-2023]MDO6527616.1 ATP-dependent zinc protease [Motilimonas sp. 1_MG-2023]